MEKIQKYYKKQVDAKRLKMENEVGQKVLLNVMNFTMAKSSTPKFISKFAGPIPFVDWMFKDVYKLELLPKIKMHSKFHVSLLKPFKEDTF